MDGERREHVTCDAQDGKAGAEIPSLSPGLDSTHNRAAGSWKPDIMPEDHSKHGSA
jgi:hypothetical protein